jgi:hypothetical protein
LLPQANVAQETLCKLSCTCVKDFVLPILIEQNTEEELAMLNARMSLSFLSLVIVSLMASTTYSQPKGSRKADNAKVRAKPAVRSSNKGVRKRARKAVKKRSRISIKFDKNAKSKRPPMKPKPSAAAHSQCVQQLKLAQKQAAWTSIALQMCKKSLAAGAKGKGRKAKAAKKKIDAAVKAQEKQNAEAGKVMITALALQCQQVGMLTCTDNIDNKVEINFNNVENAKQSTKQIKGVIRTVCKRSVMAACSSVEGWKSPLLPKP